MSRKTPPSFDFYPDDFIGGTIDMDAIEVGMFVRCLCYQWGKAMLPNDAKKLRKITGVSEQEFTDYWPAVREKLREHDGECLVNERLQVERDKKLALQEARSEAGRKGGSSKAKAKLKQKCSSRKREVGSRKKEVGSGNAEAGGGDGEIPEAIDVPEFRVAWGAWKRHRSGKNAKLTAESIRLQMKRFGEWGVARSIAAIEHTIEMGWTGIREPDANSNGASKSTQDAIKARTRAAMVYEEPGEPT